MHRYRLTAVFTALLLASLSALAAPDHGALSPDEGIRRQEERARALQDALTPAPEAPQRTASPEISRVLPAETPCFPLRQIALTGKDADSEPWLAARLSSQVLADFTGQCAGVKGISQIADAVNAWLLRNGYATSRVTLGQQNLASGALQLQLHLGRVGAVRMVEAGTTTPDTRWGIWRNAFWPVSAAGDVLNTNDVQQGVEQMNRLPSQQVATKLEPGKDPDTSDIVIERQAGSFAQRLHGGMTVDNSGSQQLGRTQLSLWASLDNPLGINDILNINGNTNAENPDPDHRSQTLAGSYSVPWGNNTFTASYNRNKFAQQVAGTTAQFLSSGDSTNGDLKWQYQLLRTSSGKLAVYTDIGMRRSHSYLDDVELLVQRRNTVNQEFGFNWQQLLGPATLSMSYGFRTGRPWFGAEDDYPSEAGLTLRPNLHTLDINLALPFSIATQPLQFTSNLHGQYTRDATTSNDQISIGNRYSVRGFDGDNVLLAESGFYLRNELSTSLPAPANVGLQGYWGVDAGRVWGASDINLIGRDLAGTAVGVRAQYKAVQADLALAMPLYYPKGFNTNPWSFYGSLTFGF